MQNSDLLVWYGIVVSIVAGALILVPYLKGKSDLVTGWNVLLLGLVLFVGIGCLEVKYGSWTWPMLQWFQPTQGEVQYYVLMSALFITALVIFYYYNPINNAITSNRLRKWPPLHASVVLFVLAFCVTLIILSFPTRGVVFVGSVTLNLSHKAAVFASVFSFYLWYRERVNLAWLFLFIGVFLAAMVFAMLVASGRRLLLSVFLGPVLCVYWMNARYWKPRNALALLACAAALIFTISVLYASFRWYHKGRAGQERNVQTLIAQVKGLTEKEGLFDAVIGNKLHYFSQWNAHYSLLTKRFVDNGQLKPKPLNTLAFLASYPIPRRLWPGKPVTVGIKLPHEVVGVTTTNWGVGVPGHAAYEGGALAILLYAFLTAIGIHLLDDPLRAQPSNPFLIAMHAAALPHVVTFPRGDFGIMTIETIECFIFAVILAVACRMVFGTEFIPARKRQNDRPATCNYTFPGTVKRPQINR
jgi:hypothetical protein